MNISGFNSVSICILIFQHIPGFTFQNQKIDPERKQQDLDLPYSLAGDIHCLFWSPFLFALLKDRNNNASHILEPLRSVQFIYCC